MKDVKFKKKNPSAYDGTVMLQGGKYKNAKKIQQLKSNEK